MGSCIITPSIGQETFNKLRKEFGYPTAKEVFLIGLDPTFQKDHKGTLRLDSEGVPSYESLVKNQYIQEVIGSTKLEQSLQKRYPEVKDTLDNYNALLLGAHSFNTTSIHRDKYIATVEYSQGNIFIKVQPKTQESMNRFNEQYNTNKLNTLIADKLKSIGVTIGHLTEAEEKSGRIGNIDFSKARNIAVDSSSMIRVANSMEGATAISEEFSHLMIGVFRDNPLVKRIIDTLSKSDEALQKILGNQYADVLEYHNGDLKLVAEEALGQILQKNLLKETNLQDIKSPSLIRRFINFIKDKFKPFNYEDIDDIITRVDSSMSRMAKDILSGYKTLTKEEVEHSNREVSFNALSDRIQRNIDILKKALVTEVKRFKILNDGEKRDRTKETISNIEEFIDKEDANTTLGLLKYAQNALSELRGVSMEFSEAYKKTPKEMFTFLRKVKIYTSSYADFINQLNEAIDSEEQEEDNMFLQDIQIGEETISIKTVIKELSSLQQELVRKYNKASFSTFAEFLKPFLGEELTVSFGKYAGTKMSVEQLLKEANKDISFLERWADAMADSSDVILQGIDAATKRQKDKARIKALDLIKKGQRIRKKAEELGITSFGWIYERYNDGSKTHRYVSEVNYSQYQKDQEEMLKSLEEKYGKKVKPQDVQAYIQERDSWYEEHAMSKYKPHIPNPVKYRNDSYFSLSDSQKQILKEFLDLKEEMDQLYPKGKTSRLKAIQMRKTGSQRMVDSLSSPTSIFNNIKENIKETFLERSDDDQLFGNSTQGLTDFEGREFMTLPVLYTNLLENSDELTDDVFKALNAYAYATTLYNSMEEIIDPLEIGKSVLLDERKTIVTKGDNQVEENVNALGETVKSKVFQQGTSNWAARLEDYYKSQIYNRYQKDEGTVLGSKVSTSKLVNYIMKVTSVAKIGFNALTQTANAVNGVAMQNIEAAAGEFFNRRELLKSDYEYSKHIPEFVQELGSRIKSSKLALFDELLDIKQDFNTKAKRVQSKKLLERVFGANIAFMGQNAGDHWLYHRTAIAMALRYKVVVPGKGVTSLWEALEVKEKFDDNSGIKELVLPKGTTSENGTPITIEDLAVFGRQIAKVNQSLFGIYNEDDANAANRVAMGRLLFQFRKFMRPLFNKRFRSAKYDVILDKTTEGYYITAYRVINELIRGKTQIGSVWTELKNEEKANIKRAIWEIAQYTCIWMLANMLEWPDDKDRPWAIKLAEYNAKRLQHELGSFSPSLTMIEENFKTLKTPVVALSTVNDLINLISSAIDPTDYIDEISSGPYKGMSIFEKHLLKAPIPGVMQYRQIDKFVGQIDNSINYYARPY